MHSLPVNIFVIVVHKIFIVWVKYDFWKLIQLYAAVYKVCMQALSIATLSKFINLHFFIILLWIQCTENCIHRQYVFGLFLPFFCSSAKLGGLRACRLTPPHLMRLLAFVLSNKRLYSLQTIHCFFLLVFFKENVNWTFLHAGHVWFLFSLCAWICHFCQMSMAFIHSLHFFGTATKKWQDFTPHPPPPPPYTSAFQLCWSAPPAAVIRLQWMRYAFQMGVDRRGSWCEGKKKILHDPFPESLVCWLKPILLFKYIPLCLWHTSNNCNA